MNKHESLDDELKSLSPWLHQLPRGEDGLKTPPGYFEGLEEAIFSKIEAQEVRRPALAARKGGLLRPKMWSAAAAVAAIAVACWWMLRPQPSVTLPTETYAEALTEAEIEAYVLDNITEFDSDQLAAVNMGIASEQMPNTAPATTATPRPADVITPAEMENLLQHMSEEELESLL